MSDPRVEAAAMAIAITWGWARGARSWNRLRFQTQSLFIKSAEAALAAADSVSRARTAINPPIVVIPHQWKAT